MNRPPAAPRCGGPGVPRASGDEPTVHTYTQARILEVARSLGVYSGTLERWFPERYAELVALHAERRQQASRAVLDRRCSVLRAAVFDLVRSGQHPSFPVALSHAGLPPTLCRVPSVRPAFEAALVACGLAPLPQGVGSALVDLDMRLGC